MTYEYFKEHYKKMTKRERSMYPEYNQELQNEKLMKEIEEIKKTTARVRAEAIKKVQAQKILENIENNEKSNK
jgi:FixJ family two-component response regulator